MIRDRLKRPRQVSLPEMIAREILKSYPSFMKEESEKNYRTGQEL